METEEIVSPIPTEMDVLMPNNLLEESKFLGDNVAEDFLRLSAAKEQDTEVVHNTGYSADLQIAEENISTSNSAFMYSEHANDSMLKVELENEYFEMENNPLYITRNTTNTDTNIRRMEILRGNANVVPVAYSTECREEFPKQKDLITSENNEPINESKLSYDVTSDDWKIKKEELDIEDAFKKETGYEDVFPNKLPVKIENCEASNESEEVYGIFFKEWKIKNEEVDMKVEDLKNETSNATCCGREKQKYNQRILHDLRCHKPQHKKPEEGNMVTCDQCDYQSVCKRNLRMHLLWHKNPPEGSGFKCDQCDFQSIYKRNLITHLLRHKNPEDINMFRCDQCDYHSLYKKNLRRHLFRHKHPKNVNMFKCDQCDYQSICNSNLKVHLLKHKNPKDVNMFKCDQCNYETVRKSNLKAHLVTHKHPNDINMFKCDHCDYQSIFLGNLRRHLLKHKNPKDVTLFKCGQCDYQAFQKYSLKTHLLRHKKPKDINMFKCNQCDYQSIYKKNFRAHLLRHKNPQDVNRFKCDQCDYQTIQKSNLKRHLLGHKSPTLNVNV